MSNNSDDPLVMRDERPMYVSRFDLPEDPLWMQTEMQLRHSIEAYTSQPHTHKTIADIVEKLDEWGRLWGLVRHGQLWYSRHSPSRFSVASHFKVVDLDRYTKQSIFVAEQTVLSAKQINETIREQLATTAECERIQQLPWWKRLLGGRFIEC